MNKIVAALKARIAYAMEPNRTIPRVLVHLGHFATGALVCVLGVKLGGAWYYGIGAAVLFTVVAETRDLIIYGTGPSVRRDSIEDAMQLMAGAVFSIMPGLHALWWLGVIAVPYVIRRVP